jgi:hypothetical protein
MLTTSPALVLDSVGVKKLIGRGTIPMRTALNTRALTAHSQGRRRKFFMRKPASYLPIPENRSIHGSRAMNGPIARRPIFSE